MKTKLFILATLLFQLNSFAQYTAIPDANFEQALIYEGYDSGPIDHQVLTANINTIPSLNVGSRTLISDLTGIQDFVALTELYCNDNQLTSLNVSGLTALRILWCYNNQLTSLNVSGLTALTTLDCVNNKLKSLNVSGLTALRFLHCGPNQLTSLNVSGCTGLTFLSCFSNQLTSLNVSGLTGLEHLDCADNQLTSLNLCGCTALAVLSCVVNPSLLYIQTGDTTTANGNWYKDATASYSLNCGLATSTYEFTKSVVVFPNPTKTILNLSTTTTIDKIIITDLTGKTVLQQTENTKQINVQNLAKGMYILQAYSGKEKFISKFVKE